MTTRQTPDRSTAEGMRKGILAQRRREGRKGPHPYNNLDFRLGVDRRIIASVYADMVRR